MEQTVTCPNCGYSFRIAKETFEKYREGISLKKHQMTDGEAILLDCVGCGRVLKISIRTWNVVAEGPAEHERGYEWVGGKDRPRLADGEYTLSDGAAAVPERIDPTATLIRLTEYGRAEKPLPEAGLGVMLGILLLCALPVAMMLGEPMIIASADDPDYTVAAAPEKRLPEPEAAVVPAPAAVEQRPAEKPEPEAEMPRLLTPVKEPTLLRGSKFEKILRNYNRQIEDADKQTEPVK